MPNSVKDSPIYTILIARLALIATYQGRSRENEFFSDFVIKAYNRYQIRIKPNLERLFNEGLNQLVPDLQKVKEDLQKELSDLSDRQIGFASKTINNLTQDTLAEVTDLEN